MTIDARVAANRENAKKSTGPRTTQGKRISARNALKHGFRANLILDNCILAEHESPRPFGLLLKDLVRHLQPVGPLEEFCVETIATCMWRLRRVVGEEHNLIDRLHVDVDDIQAIRDLDRDPDAEPELILYPYLPKPEDLTPLLRYERHLSRERRLALRELRELQAIRMAADSDLPDPIPAEQQKLPNEPILTPHLAPSSPPTQDLSNAPASASCDRGQSPRHQLSTTQSVPNEANVPQDTGIVTKHYEASDQPAAMCGQEVAQRTSTATILAARGYIGRTAPTFQLRHHPYGQALHRPAEEQLHRPDSLPQRLHAQILGNGQRTYSLGRFACRL